MQLLFNEKKDFCYFIWVFPFNFMYYYFFLSLLNSTDRKHIGIIIWYSVSQVENCFSIKCGKITINEYFVKHFIERMKNTRSNERMHAHRKPTWWNSTKYWFANKPLSCEWKSHQYSARFLLFTQFGLTL